MISTTTSTTANTTAIEEFTKDNTKYEEKKGWGAGLLQILAKPNNVLKQVQQTALQIRSMKSIFLKGTNKDICDYVLRHPESCCSKYTFGDLGNQFPLTIVCRRCKTISVQTIRTVYEANPDAILGTLHHACAKQPTVEVVAFIISNHPDGAKTMQKGLLALHTAVSCGASLSVVQYLIDCYPEGLQTRDGHRSRLPIHVAMEYHASMDIIRLLISKYPEGLQLANYHTTKTIKVNGWIKHFGSVKSYDISSGGGLPLHLACRENYPLEYIKYLILQYPDALRTKNSFGWLPLHYACYAGASLKVIQMMVSCCPTAILEHTADFRFPVDMATSRYNPNVAVLQFLISRHPTTFCKPKQYLFYHYLDEATVTYTSANVIEFLRNVSYQAGRGYAFVYPREESTSF